MMEGTSTSKTPESAQPIRQERSRATLNRILEATEELLQDRLLEEIKLGDVVERSGVSVGAFYARLSNKDALVACLYERYDAQITAGSARVLDPARWKKRTLDQRAALLFRYSAMLYRRSRGLMRALALRARIEPGFVTAAQMRNRQELYDALTVLFLERRREMACPDPESAVRVGLLMVGSTFREKILYDSAPQAQSVRATDAWLAREMTRAFLSYVGFRRSSK